MHGQREEAIVPNTGLPCAYCHCPHRRAPTASPRPRTSLPSASITWETAVGVMFRRPSYRPLWADTIQQKKTAGAIITMGQKLPGMPTKPGYTNAAPSMTSAPTVPVTKNTLQGHPVYHLHIPVPAQRHARGHHAGHRDGKTGNGNGIYRQINIVSGGKIAEPGDARDFLPLDGNFEQGADDFGQHRRQGQDDGPLLETLPFIFRQALLPFPPSIRQTAAASARISAQKASAAAPALSLTSSSLTTPRASPPRLGW